MKSFLWTAALLTGATLAAPAIAASADSYPARPISIVVPYPPGGGTDNTARLIAERLAKRLGQSVIIDNRAGANGTIGANHVAKAAPDGYTLLFAGLGPLAVNAAITASMPYDSATAFAPIVNVSSAPMVIAVNPKVPAKTVAELVAYGKQNPDRLFAGNAGKGSPHHICAGLFARATGTPIQPVPYKGAAPALTDLVGGAVQMTCENVGTIQPYVQGNRVRPLGVTSDSRSPLMPDVPTLGESGIKGVEFSLWFMLVAPAGTPAPIVEKLNHEMNDVLKMPEVIAQLQGQANTAEGGTVARAAEHLRSENERWRTLGPEIGLTKD